MGPSTAFETSKTLLGRTGYRYEQEKVSQSIVDALGRLCSPEVDLHGLFAGEIENRRKSQQVWKSKLVEVYIYIITSNRFRRASKRCALWQTIVSTAHKAVMPLRPGTPPFPKVALKRRYLGESRAAQTK